MVLNCFRLINIVLQGAWSFWFLSKGWMENESQEEDRIIVKGVQVNALLPDDVCVCAFPQGDWQDVHQWDSGHLCWLDSQLYKLMEAFNHSSHPLVFSFQLWVDLDFSLFVMWLKKQFLLFLVKCKHPCNKPEHIKQLNKKRIITILCESKIIG